MRQLLFAVAMATGVAFAAAGSKSDLGALTGRWDLTVTTPKDTYPSWMEVMDKGGTPEVRVVGRVASVHPGKKVKFDGRTLTFETTEWLGKQRRVRWEITPAGGKVSGRQRWRGTTAQLVGERAPELHRSAPAAWTDPEPLFNGKDLSGWEPLITEPGKATPSYWKAINGELVNEKAGANLRTTRTFQDFKLHVEYSCPDKGNSGIYLRGRYEIQVEYAPPGIEDPYHGMGAIYGFLAPAANVPRKPGEWESFDVTLVGRMVTVVRDGVTIIDNQEIPGITGGAIDSHEGEPGPIYVQGDHTAGMKLRNVTISVPR